MNKGLIFLLCYFALCNVAYAQADRASLERTLEANNVQGKIISNSDLGSGLSMVVIEISNQHVPFLATNDGKMLFQPDVSIFQDKNTQTYIQGFYKEFYAKEKVNIDTRLQDIFKVRSEQVFSFKSKKNTKKTIYIVSDPNCPYCQKEFANLSKRLEEANVKLLLVGFLGEDSMFKVAHALKNKTGNQAKDMAMLGGLYAPKTKAKPIDTKMAKILTQAIADAGVRSVPYIIGE